MTALLCCDEIYLFAFITYLKNRILKPFLAQGSNLENSFSSYGKKSVTN